MRVGRREGDCGDRRGGHVHRGLCEHALHDDEVRGGAHGEVHDEAVLRDEDGGDGEVPQESREECEGWASETKAHRREVEEGRLLPRAREVVGVERVLCGHLCHGDQGHEVHDVHEVPEEDHVFCRDEPKGPRIPDRRKD